MPQEKNSTADKHALNTRSVLFWVNKQKFEAWKKYVEEKNTKMTNLIIRAVDEEIKRGTVESQENERLAVLEARNKEILDKLDGLYVKNAEIVKNDASVNDDTVQATLIALLRAKGQARDDELAGWMNADRIFVIDVLTVMQQAGKVKQDKTYGWWSLP